jgi:hypothetical protein
METSGPLVTHLSGVDAFPVQHAPPAGTRVEIRRAGAGFEAWLPAGLRLGQIPPSERDTLDAMFADGAPVEARVSAVVPRPGPAPATRIHIEIRLAEPA